MTCAETLHPGTPLLMDDFMTHPTWDDHQRAVIEAPLEKRLLVDAGPGTGKTAVACGRISWLIDRGVEPTNIWLISFTRTAVKEHRDRIAGLFRERTHASEVRI